MAHNQSKVFIIIQKILSITISSPPSQHLWSFLTLLTLRHSERMAAADSGVFQPPTSADWRLVDKALQKLDKLHELCTNPRLGLRNSPPYLPELVSETTALLMQVWEPYRDPMAVDSNVPRGDEAKYLKVHVKNLLDKTDRALLLFKEGREKVFEESSSYR